MFRLTSLRMLTGCETTKRLLDIPLLFVLTKLQLDMTELEQALESDPNNVNLFAQGVKIGEVGAIHLQKHIQQYQQTIRLIELKGSCVGRRGAEYIARAIRGSSLLHLGVGRNGLDYAAATSLINCLKGTPIQTLDLEWNSLQDGVAESIADLLRHTSTLVSISLERNDFRSEGISAIAKALTVNTSLRNLNLAFNRCGSLACEALGAMLEQNTTLLTLNLTQCSITADAARYLAKGMSSNNTLVALNLHLNQAIDSFSGRTSGGAVTFNVRFSSAMRELNFGCNRISSTFVEPFARILGESTSLVALSLGKCLFGEPAVRHILQGVSKLTRLVTLDLSGCLISQTSGDLLQEMLTRCPNIATLFLDDNPLGRFGVEGVSNGLPFCSSLTSLNMCRCGMGREGMSALAGALVKRSGLPLRELRVAGNNLSYDGCLTLCDALCVMKGDASKDLEVLDISDNDIGGRTCAFLAAVLQAHRNTLLSVTLRDNPIAEETKHTFLTLEGALSYTGGVISDPTMKIGHSLESLKSTFEVDKASQSPTKAQRLTNSERSPVGVTNFNGSSESMLRSYESPAAKGRHTIDRTTASAAAVALPTEPPQLAPIHDMSPYAPGLVPIVPQFKQRHMLHEVEENIMLLPISDTQLRTKFTQLDGQCVGFLTVPAFLQAYAQMDPLSFDAELSSKRITDDVKKLCPDGKVYYQQFCILMLRLANT